MKKRLVSSQIGETGSNLWSIAQRQKIQYHSVRIYETLADHILEGMKLAGHDFEICNKDWICIGLDFRSLAFLYRHDLYHYIVTIKVPL